MKTTPEVITKLEPNQVFVFGSNLAGRHGAGAAKQALKFGAILGKGIGLWGQTYALPTKDWNLNTLSLEDVAYGICEFLRCANCNPKIEFLVTKIGCGLAGYKPEQIRAIFSKHAIPPNVILPTEFIKTTPLLEVSFTFSFKKT